MKHSVYLRLQNLVLFACIILGPIFSHAVNNRTTYQAKIIKPDGLPLEAVNVNFKFTILDPAASCVLYSEEYTAVNMLGSGGLVFFSLGAGNRTYPVSGGATLENVLDNSVVSFPCQTPGLYTPTSADNRKIVMQFNDGYGWQTLPAMAINSVPYAMYAGKSDNAVKFNGKSDSAFVEYSSLASLNCQSNEAIKFNGVGFACISVVSSAGISSVTTSGSVLSTGGTASAPVISITAASMSSDGYLTSLDYAEFKAKLDNNATAINSTLGFAPVSSAAVTTMISAAQASQTLAGDVSGNISSNTVDNVGGKSAAQISASVDDTLAATASSTANTIVKRNSSGNFTANDIYANAAKINYADIYKPSTNFSVRLQTANSLSANYVLTLPDTAGSAGQVLSTDGSGNLSWINAATGSVTSVSGTLNEITSSGGVTPTLGLANIGTAGTYYKVTTDNKGRITSGSTTLQLSDLPNTVLNTTSNFAGDISGIISNITVNRIQGVSVTVTSLTTNDILQYDGSKYINKNIPTCSGSQYLTFNGTSFSCAFDAGASGTVASISVTGPISSTGGSNPTLSITQANSTTNGYLSSTDWNTFNNKQNATSATQWTTSGSNIYYNTGNIGVGVINPSAKLELAPGTASVAPLKFTSGTLLTSAQSGTMEYDGFNFYLTDSTNTRRTIATGSSAGAIDNASNINSSGNITMTPVGSVIVSSTTASTNSNTGALVVKGGLGVTGNINTAGNLNVSGSQVVDGSLKLSSMTSGSVLFAGANGTVTQDNSSLYWDGANKRLGIGSNSPAQTLSVSGTSYFSGNVGIGTGSPEAKLDVRSGLKSGNNVLAIFKTTDAQPEQFFIENQGNTGVTLQAGEQFVGNNNLLLNTYGGNVGIGTSAPSAKLHLAAGTVSTAPFKFTSGTLLSSPQSGTMEFDGSAFYLTDGAGNRRTIAAGANPSTIDDASYINSTGNITMTPVGSVVVSSTTASTNSATGALIVNGGAGIAGNLNVSGTISSNSGINLNNSNDFILRAGASLPNDPGDIVWTNSDASERARIYSGTASSPVINFSVGSSPSTKMTILENGNVGIGTSSPDFKFKVVDSTAGAVMGLQNTNSAGYSGVQMQLADNSNWGAFFGYQQSTDHMRYNVRTGYHAFFTNSVEKMRIDSSGNVGIGTSNPLGKLWVPDLTDNGQSQIQNLIFNGSGILGYTGTEIWSNLNPFVNTKLVAGGWAYGLDLGRNGDYFAINRVVSSSLTRNQLLKIDGVTGNVGIGTITPAYKLSVVGGDIALDRTSKLQFAGPVAGDSNRAYIAGNPNNELIFGIGGATEAMRIHNSGNVGIGTTAPSAKLHLAAGTASTASLKFTSGTLLTSVESGTMEYDGSQFYLTDGTNTRRTIATGSSAGTIDNASTINSSGNITMVPVGSVVVSSTTASTNSSTGALVVKGGLGVAGNIYSSGTIITSSNIQGSSITATSGISTNVIQGNTNLLLNPNGGNVGVGTTSPAYLLTVNGATSNAVDPMFKVINSRTPATADWVNGFELNAPNLVNNSYLYFSLGKAASTNNRAAIQYTHAADGSSSNRLEFGFYGADSLLNILASGNVGIGTTTPNARLQVSGSMVISSDGVAGSVGALRVKRVSTDADNIISEFYYADAGVTNPRMQILGSPNKISLKTTYSSGGADLELGTNTVSSALVIKESGNVGIGTTTPGSKLQVVGGAIRSDLGTTGPTFIATGTGSNFQVSHDGSANVALFNSGGGIQFRGTDGTTNLVTILSGGNVGIGTSSPTRLLHLHDSTGSNNYFQMSTAVTGITTTDGFQIALDGTSSDVGLIQRENSKLYLSTNNTPRMTILGDGNVGIGTTAPGAPLNVTAKNGSNVIASFGSLAQQVTGTEILFVGQNNAVSGSVDANALGLTLNHAAANASPNGGFTYQFRINDDSSANLYGSMIRSTKNAASNSTYTTFETNSTIGAGVERMRIDSAGNVGVGTTTPGLLLETSGVNGYPATSGTTQTGSFRIGNSVSQRVLDFGIDGATSTAWLQATTRTNLGDKNSLVLNPNGGSVGIGTTAPGEKLDVIGNMRIGSSDSNYLAFRGTTGDGAGSYNHTYIGERFYAAGESSELFLFKGNDSDNTSGPDRIRLAGGNILFDTYASPDAPSGAFETVAQSPLISTKMIIKGNGFVGIGTSAPGYTLDVSGTLRVAGQAYTNTGNGSFSILSDIRYKDVHGKFDRGLSEILNIDVIKFNYKKNNPLGSDSNREYVGVSAQNLQNFIPEAVESRKVGTEEYLTINTSPVLWTLINAIKQLYKEIEPLKQAAAKIDKLEAENAAKTKEIVALKAYLCSKDPAAAICQ